MLRQVLLLILLSTLLSACSMVGVSNYTTFAMRFGSDHPKQPNIDGWYQIPVRLPRNSDLERPFVAHAKTMRAPVYHQVVDTRHNMPGLPALYCNYVFTFDRKDRLRSVAVRDESCSQNPI